MDVIFSKYALLGNSWKLVGASLSRKHLPRHGAQLEPQLKHQPLHVFLPFYFTFIFILCHFAQPPPFFPTGLWAPLAALLVPSSPPPWRGGGHWSGPWVGATIPRHRHKSRTAGTSTRCPWWYDISWSRATSVWSCWQRLHWDSPFSCSSTTVCWFNSKYTTLLSCCFSCHCAFIARKCVGHCLAAECLPESTIQNIGADFERDFSWKEIILCCTFSKSL